MQVWLSSRLIRASNGRVVSLHFWARMGSQAIKALCRPSSSLQIQYYRSLLNMLFPTYTLAVLFVAGAILTSVSAICCGADGRCPRTALVNQISIELLQDAVWNASLDNSTLLDDGQHVVCISRTQEITLSGSPYGPTGVALALDANIEKGGICLSTYTIAILHSGSRSMDCVKQRLYNYKYYFFHDCIQ